MTRIEKLENLLGIKLEEHRLGNDYDPHQKNHYSGKDGFVDRLHLNDIEITDLAAIFAITGELSALNLVNTSIPNFSDLLAFDPYYLTLDGVTIHSNDCLTISKLPAHLKFFNMHIDVKALTCFAKSKIGGYRQVEFHNCHLDNIQYIGTIPQISCLVLDKITFTYEALEEEIRCRIYRIEVHNSKLDHVSFIPFKKDLYHIEFIRCKIRSLSGLEEFRKLMGITINSDTQVKDKTVLPNTFKRSIHCSIFRAKSPLDLEQILPLKKYISRLEVNGFKGDELPHLKKFKRLRHLELSGGKVNLEAFLPIAAQIKSICMNRAHFFNHACFVHFKNVTSFELSNFSKGKKALLRFERLLPLKNQLKELEVYDVKKIKDVHVLKEFKALESLKINQFRAKDADHVLQMKHLKRLQLRVQSKEKNQVLNLEQLTKLEFLILETKMKFKGLEHLQKLKSLQLGSDYGKSTLDIKSLPKIESLERLNITDYSQKFKHLWQFPNLKYLKIKGCKKLNLKTMKNLEVLDLENSAINDFSKFGTQPRLKKLDLSSLYDDNNLKGLHNFPNLRVLDLMDSNVSDISALEPLKKLEYLDLYYTSVTDVTVINTLPKMKEINLATFTKADLESQLDRPEIAVYVGLPTKYLSVWRKDEFGI